MKDSTIIVAGASGNLGGHIAAALVQRGADVRALVRDDTAAVDIRRLENLGASIHAVDLSRGSAALDAACAGASCVVSALVGLREVIVDAQSVLLHAALNADVPRFIPSDYSIDFTKMRAGQNRNLDLRREFHSRLDRAAIAATTIFNGAFTELLTGPMPLILFKLRRVLYWGSADEPMDFTSLDNVASFTASAALDATAPRFLRVAGDTLTARELAAVVSEVTGRTFRLMRGGSLRTLARSIRVLRAIAPAEDDLYPAWQSLQYVRNMFEGSAKLEPLDNDRYPWMTWTSVRGVLRRHLGRQKQNALQVLRENLGRD